MCRKPSRLVLPTVALTILYLAASTLEYNTYTQTHPATTSPIHSLRQRIKQLLKKPQPKNVATNTKEVIRDLQATSYPPFPKYTDDTPTVTASGSLVGPGVLAVSRDLYSRRDINFGTRVQVLGFPSLSSCVFIVKDTMGEWVWINSKKIRQVRTVDLFMPTVVDAQRWGRQRHITIRLLPGKSTLPVCTYGQIRLASQR